MSREVPRRKLEHFVQNGDKNIQQGLPKLRNLNFLWLCTVSPLWLCITYPTKARGILVK